MNPVMPYRSRRITSSYFRLQTLLFRGHGQGFRFSHPTPCSSFDFNSSTVTVDLSCSRMRCRKHFTYFDSPIQRKGNKSMFLHRMVSRLSDHSNRFTFHPWQTCSFRHQPDVCGRYSATPQSLYKDYTNVFPLLSIATYSIQS